MTYLPGINQPIPASPLYSEPISSAESPMVYSTDGPLAAGNGIAFTRNGIVFDPNKVSSGDLDCGLFGVQAQ